MEKVSWCNITILYWDTSIQMRIHHPEQPRPVSKTIKWRNQHYQLQEAKKKEKRRRTIRIRRQILFPILECPILECPEHIFHEEDHTLLSNPSNQYSPSDPPTRNSISNPSKQISLFDSFSRKKMELKPPIETK